MQGDDHRAGIRVRVPHRAARREARKPIRIPQLTWAPLLESHTRTFPRAARTARALSPPKRQRPPAQNPLKSPTQKHEEPKIRSLLTGEAIRNRMSSNDCVVRLKKAASRLSRHYTDTPVTVAGETPLRRPRRNSVSRRRDRTSRDEQTCLGTTPF